MDKGNLVQAYDSLNEKLLQLESENITLEKTLHMQSRRLDKRIENLSNINAENKLQIDQIESENDNIKDNYRTMDKYESERELSYLNHIAKLEQRKIERITRGQNQRGLSEDFENDDEVRKFTSINFTSHNRASSAAFTTPVKLYAKSGKKVSPYLYSRGLLKPAEPL